MITPDPAVPEGAAIIDLAERMQALQDRTGEWPGADTVTILGTWLAGFDFASPLPRTRHVAGSVWVLRRQDRHADQVSLWADEQSALADLAEHVRSSWDNVRGRDGIPEDPPLDDRRAVDLYYGPREHRGDEDYSLYGEDIGRLVRTPSTPARFLFPGEGVCAEANSAAVFHAPAGPGGEGLPCMEVAGVLVFAYLDASMQAVRVSVHLDTADELVLQPGDWVPLHVDVEGSTVFSAGATPVRALSGQRWRRVRWLSRRLRWPRGD